MRTYRFAPCYVLPLVAILALASPALAANAENAAAADVLFKEAKQLASAGDFARACPKFIESQRLDPSVGTLLNIGNCYEKLGKLAIGQGQYTLMLNDDAGVIDDLILYRLSEEQFLLVVNAAKIAEDRAWLQQRLPSGVAFEDRSAATGALALQGPRSLQIARALLGAGWPMPEHNHITAYSWNCQPVFAARTGYTGEDGFELIVGAASAPEVWNALLEMGQPHGIAACGLGARDTLRLEAAMPLYGHELSESIDPYTAGVGWAVKLEKGDFTGRDALVRAKAQQKTAAAHSTRVGLELEGKRIATEVVNLTRRWLASHGVEAHVEFSWGQRRSSRRSWRTTLSR